MNRKTGLSALVVILLFLTSCAKAPMKEKAAAEQARMAALAADAEHYARATMTSAQKLWDQAETFLKQKRYAAAKKAYRIARKAYEKAADLVSQNKDVMVSAVNEGVTEADQEWQSMSKKVDQMGKRMSKDMRKAWKQDTMMVLTSLQSARSFLKEQHPLDARQQLNNAKMLIEKWRKLLKSKL